MGRMIVMHCREWVHVMEKQYFGFVVATCSSIDGGRFVVLFVWSDDCIGSG